MTKSEDERAFDRRRFLQRVTWVGTGAMWALASGALRGMPMTGLREDGAKATPAGGTQVIVDNFSFKPATIAVPVGTTVTWTNQDEDPHTITSAAGAFTSSGLSHDETFTQTFRERGTYQYFCALHPQMRATVIVK